jgi:hypothetical protein
MQAGEYARALRMLEEIKQKGFNDIDPDVVYNSIGAAQLKMGGYDEALDSFTRAQIAKPMPEYAANIAQAYMYKFDPEAAINTCELALTEFIDRNSKDLNNIHLKAASAYDMNREYQSAKHHLRYCDPAPDIYVYVGMKEMQLGNYKNGKLLYQSRANAYTSLIPNYDSMEFISARGEAISEGTVTVLLEQGLGDCLMMLPNLLNLCEVYGVFLDIVSIDGRHDAFIDDIISAHGHIETLGWKKCHSSVVHALRGPFVWMFDLLDEESRFKPCLKVDPQVASLADDCKDYVGICWRGNPAHQNDYWRSMKIEAMLPLIKSRKCISLQMDLTDHERAFLKKNGVYVWDKKGLVSLSAIVSKLNSVVTVDTALSHLAGVIGTDCLTMVPTNSDWRWGIEGETSRFYGDNHRIVRQETCGDWKPVVEKVYNNLGGK